MKALRFMPKISTTQGNRIAWTAKTLNTLATEQIQTDSDWYQLQFGMFEHLTLNNKGKYVIHRIASNILMWGEGNVNCTWNPMGQASIDKFNSVEPCHITLQAEWCPSATVLDSCFDTLIGWNNSTASIKNTASGQNMVQDVLDEIVNMSMYGARVLAIAGGINKDNKLDPDLSEKEKALFKAKNAPCIGIVPAMNILADQNPKAAHLNTDVLRDPALFNAAGEFVGETKEIFEKLRDAAPKQLQKIIRRGNIGGRGGRPLFIVTDALYNSLHDEFMCITALDTAPCIKQMAVTSNGETVMVFYLYNVPVIPLSEVCEYDQWVCGTNHWAALTVARNMCIGTSFGPIMNDRTFQGREGLGIIIQEMADVDELGKYKILGHALVGNMVYDYRYTTASHVYVTPEPTA